jgi:hypothetical protein
MFEPFGSPPCLDIDKAKLSPDFTPDSPLQTPTAITHTKGAMALGGANRQELPVIVEHTVSIHCTPQQLDTEPAPQASRKGKVVYKPQANKRDLQPQEYTSTRRRQLPVHWLALVRTSTADGLPEPSVRAVCVTSVVFKLLIHICARAWTMVRAAPCIYQLIPSKIARQVGPQPRYRNTGMFKLLLLGARAKMYHQENTPGRRTNVL